MKTRGYLLTLLTSSAFGLGAVLGKMASSALNPFLVASLNFLIGGLLLLAFLAWRRIRLWQPLARRDWRNIILLSIFGTALPACCIIYGLGLTSAIKAGFLIQLQGVMATIFAVIFLREHLSWKQVAGMLLLLVGGLFVIMKDLHNSFWSAFTLGDALVILGCIGFGYALVPAKQLVNKIDALPLTTWKLLISALVTMPLLLTQPNVIPNSTPNFLFWLMPLYIVSNFCIAYITQQAGLKYLHAWESATIMQTTPIFSTLSAIFILGDTLSPLQLLGGGIMLGGGCIVALSDMRISKKAAQEPTSMASSARES
ncbi:DMT family transporter [Ktedonospora formicarum]|uniref:Membrane protein n=1 Tax=Ktedonospora formicarum TaxID=2778364 RepID=A0A8J3I8U0_9CHLR|nr:DMT family transporter [Ktedonospora formicarum]GHO46794.1 membrane protein [Ktedonospora formicarum]